jgi:hypothetical protein
MTPTDVETLVRLLIGGDPAAAAAIAAQAATSTEPLVLTAAALLDPGRPELMSRALTTAVRRRDRELTALASAHLAGDRDRVTALAREHLLDHPDSVLAAWIAAGAPPAPSPTPTPAGAVVTSRPPHPLETS